jgi:hypothetical protein
MARWRWFAGLTWQLLGTHRNCSRCRWLIVFVLVRCESNNYVQCHGASIVLHALGI